MRESTDLYHTCRDWKGEPRSTRYLLPHSAREALAGSLRWVQSTAGFLMVAAHVNKSIFEMAE